MRNKGISFTLVFAVLVSVLICGMVRNSAEDGSSLAADSVGAATFDAVVNYDDNIQITYLVMDSEGKVSVGPSDIQLGVLKDKDGNTVIRQLYCAAATVRFHSSSHITHPSPYVDQVSGYVIATADTADLDSEAPNFLNNQDQIMWLLANGYYGDGTGLSVNNESVNSLRARYPNLSPSDTAIDAKIALVATKLAIWHFSDPMVSIMSTKLSPDDQRKMYNLEKALIADANRYAANPAPLGMQMNLTIDNRSADFVTDSALSTKHYFYGPLTVESTNPDVNSGMDKIFLSLSGRNHGSIDFVKDNGGSPSIAELDKATEYGYPELTTTDQYKAPYVTAGQRFWLKVPEIDRYEDLSGIAVNASARANDVTYTQATPQLVVYGDPASTNGGHEWTEVQAFVGLMDKGVKGDIYGKAQLQLHGGVPLGRGHVSVTKIMLDADGNVVTPTEGDEFTVSLTPTPAATGKPIYRFTLNSSNHWTMTAAVTDGAYTVAEDKNPANHRYRFVSQSDDEITIYHGDPKANYANIWIKNQQEPGKVKIRKTVQLADGTEVAPLNRDLFVIGLSKGGVTAASIGLQGAIFNGVNGYTTGEIELPAGRYDVSELYDERYSLVSCEEGSIVVPPGDTVILDVVNRQHVGNVKVKKVVEVNGRTVMPSPGAVYTVTLTDERDRHNIFTFTLDETNHYEKALTNIPVGVYDINETGVEGTWTASYSAVSVRVSDGSETEITVTNSAITNPNGGSDGDDGGGGGSGNDNGGNDNGNDGNGSNDGEGDDGGGTSDTGDTMNLALWVWIMIASAAAITVMATLWRRIYWSSLKQNDRRPSA
ncbi:MAG: thioester domain-containing protein [Clostridiales Family XIII bacterium]|jgi:hypothetical protein|nr:thioester domain-containing protein [Clostridiales Family XIII bacterium]